MFVSVREVVWERRARRDLKIDARQRNFCEEHKKTEENGDTSGRGIYNSVPCNLQASDRLVRQARKEEKKVKGEKRERMEGPDSQSDAKTQKMPLPREVNQITGTTIRDGRENRQQQAKVHDRKIEHSRAR